MDYEWGMSVDSGSHQLGYAEIEHHSIVADSDKQNKVATPWTRRIESNTMATTAIEIVYNAQINARLSRIEDDLREVKAMLQQFYNAEHLENELLELRDIPRDQAKEEIAKYFENHHGDSFDEATLQDALKVSIWTIIDVCDELEKEGRIRGI